MTHPDDDPEDLLEVLQVNEMMTALAHFIRQHDGSPMVTSEVARALSHLETLCHTARERGRAAERREQKIQAAQEPLWTAATAARAFLQALEEHKAARQTGDPDLIKRAAEANARIGETSTEALSHLGRAPKAEPQPSETDDDEPRQ